MKRATADHVTIAPEHRRLIDLELREGERLLWASEGRSRHPVSPSDWIGPVTLMSVTAVVAVYVGLLNLLSVSWWLSGQALMVVAWGGVGVVRAGTLVRSHLVYLKTAEKVYALTDRRVLRITAAEQAVDYSWVFAVRRVRASGEADDGRLEIEDGADRPIEMMGIRNGAEAARILAGLQPKRGPRTARRPSSERRVAARTYKAGNEEGQKEIEGSF